jgi:hypothetical protein
LIDVSRRDERALPILSARTQSNIDLGSPNQLCRGILPLDFARLMFLYRAKVPELAIFQL